MSIRAKSASGESELPSASPVRPQYFRLPRPGKSDEFYHLSRAFYYVLEKRGELKLVRLTAPGKRRGVTLINFDEVARFIAKQREQQQNGGGAK
jgi:hypothetical protein